MSSLPGKRLIPCFLLVVVVLSAPVAVRGQDVEGIQAVFRISKKRLDERVAQREVVANIPFCAIVLDTKVRGIIQGRGRLAVDLLSAEEEARFVVTGQGNGYTYATGVRGPLVIQGPASGPFRSRTIVRFDGSRFIREETTTWAEVHGAVDEIHGRHPGVLGKIVSRLARPIVEALIPQAEAEAVPFAKYYLANFVNDTAEEIIRKLNQTTPIEQSMHRIFPKTRDWVFVVSASESHLQAGFGPPGSPMPKLPQSDKIPSDSRMEMWLRTVGKEAKFLEDLAQRPLARALLKKYLEETLPELAALTDDISVVALGPWVVIVLGEEKER
jgi:hypothetical protein